MNPRPNTKWVRKLAAVGKRSEGGGQRAPALGRCSGSRVSVSLMKEMQSCDAPCSMEGKRCYCKGNAPPFRRSFLSRGKLIIFTWRRACQSVPRRAYIKAVAGQTSGMMEKFSKETIWKRAGMGESSSLQNPIYETKYPKEKKL